MKSVSNGADRLPIGEERFPSMIEEIKVTSACSGRLMEHRARLASVRAQARRLSQGSSTGIQVAAAISDGVDQFLIDLLSEDLSTVDPSQQATVEQNAAVVAVGGSGRRAMAPYSDVDLLFLHRASVTQLFTQWSSQCVRDLWDAGVQLGHSVRTMADAVAMARREPKFATSLVDARLLWGSGRLFHQLRERFRRKIVLGRIRDFAEDCIVTRRQETEKYGSTIHELQPDVKRSQGGLRDIHLIQWLGFAYYGASTIDLLRLMSALRKEDARRLLAAEEFLTRIRVDLHFAAGHAQDVLSREEQLRLADERRIAATSGQRSVERLMQVYFQHSTAVAEIAERFVNLHRPPSISSRIMQFLMTHRANGMFLVSPERIDVIPRQRSAVAASLERVLNVYESACLYGVSVAPRLAEIIKESVARIDTTSSREATRMFLSILKRSKPLGGILRGMYATGVLEIVLPEMVHARCLLQFNGYHSYTVDEHTLRAVEAVTRLEDDQGPLGVAYRAIRHKDVLHLAILLHDLGKGFDEDHSEVGRRLAQQVADRLCLPDHKRELLVFLVHKHLLMAHLAFRRDISDQDVLLQFSHEVGSPEALRMLYTLTAADVMAVGPGIWNSWKAELLAQLYDSAMLHLSGEHFAFQQQERIVSVKRDVREKVNIVAATGDWIDRQLDACQRHYLTGTDPRRIAADLQIVRGLKSDDVVVEAAFDKETTTIDCRVIIHESRAAGCFHRIAGALTSKRLDILAAQISTTLDGTVIDSFRVVDNDFDDEVPRSRLDDVSQAVRQVLTGAITVDELFPVPRRFNARFREMSVSNLAMRVVIDNESSTRCTIVDVFAHDRPGLLYTLSRAISMLGLSVLLAKIATHLDQVVDVFYVTEADGRKVQDEKRLTDIRCQLESCMIEFERRGYKTFVS